VTGDDPHRQVQIAVREPSQVGDARRRVTALARLAGLNDTQVGACAVIAAEMATNLVKHAEEGDLVMRALADSEGPGIEMLSMDRGPGMHVDHSFEDGHSTTGSSGIGLGAIRRIASNFDVHSLPGRGTTMVARVRDRTTAQPAGARPLTGVICLPMPGEQASGDAWLSESSGSRTLCAVVDGLGHGPLAAQAARLAIKTLQDHYESPLTELIEHVHAALAPTRGATLAVTNIVHGQSLIKFVGIGNIMAAVYLNGTKQHMLSQNGVVGHQVGRIKEFQYAWSSQALLVMCSDGIKTIWDVTTYPGLASRDPSLIAATLYRDFARGRDDTTVMVLKMAEPPS
jgi:anti-sigma regulatory factor (Ser/Thr protein kinase)